MGILQGLVLIPLFLYVKEVEGKSNAASFTLRDILSIFTSRNLALLILVAPLCIFCNSSFLNIMPFYLKKVDPNISDFFIGLTFIGGIIGAFVGVISKQVIRLLKNEWNVILVGVGTIGASIQLLFFHSILAAAVGLLGISLGFALMNSMILGVLNRTTHLSKSLTNSVFLSIYYILGSVGTYVPLNVYINFGILMYDVLVMLAVGSALSIVWYLKGRIRLEGN